MKVYLSPSQQQHNIGVGAYGSEAYRCQAIADRVRMVVRQTSGGPLDIVADNLSRPKFACVCLRPQYGY